MKKYKLGTFDIHLDFVRYRLLRRNKNRNNLWRSLIFYQDEIRGMNDCPEKRQIEDKIECLTIQLDAFRRNNITQEKEVL